MRRLLLSAAVVLLFSTGCAESDDGSEEGTGFRLSGRVTDTATGVDTSGIPTQRDTAADAGAGDARTDDEGPSEAGSLDIEVSDPNELASEIRGCGSGGAYTVLFTPETTIIPSEIVGNDDFPDNLDGETVDVTGTMYRDGGEDACQLVATSIAAESVGDQNPRETVTPGPIPGGSEGGAGGSSAPPGAGGAQSETASRTPAADQQ